MKRTATLSPSPAAPEWPKTAAPSTSSAPSSSTDRKGRLISRTSTSSSPAARQNSSATIDSSIGRPAPPPPARPVLGTEFGGVKGAGAVSGASNGDVYVLNSSKRDPRFKENGAPDDFTAPAAGGSNELPASFQNYLANIAVDNSSGPFSGDFFVAPGNGAVKVYASSGEEVGNLSGFDEPSGIAVDSANGVVYVAEYESGRIYRLEPTSSAMPISKADYQVTALEVRRSTRWVRQSTAKATSTSATKAKGSRSSSRPNSARVPTR